MSNPAAMPRIVVLTRDLMFPSQIAGIVRAAGATMQIVGTAEAGAEHCATAPSLAIIDLASSPDDIAATVATLRASGAKQIVAFGPHVHVDRLREARAAGADQVLTRGQMHGSAGEIIGAFVAIVPGPGEGI